MGVESSAAQVRLDTDAGLAQVLRSHGDRLLELMPEAVDLVAGLSTLTQGGKRLRPLFFWWGYYGVEGPAVRGVTGGESVRVDVQLVGAAFELFHAAALLHDDVMDRSDTRRNLPALHKRLEGEFVARQWQGDSAQFGVSGAILAGDLGLSWSEAAFAEAMLVSPEPAAHQVAARRLFDDMRSELMVGQYLDMSAQAAGLAHNEVAKALRVIKHKSAQYSMTYPVAIGATLAGADEATVTVLRQYGDAVGLAFQLRDDLLGVFGDPEQTGKPAGDDLVEGKQTVLLAAAKERLTQQQVQELADAVGTASLSGAQVDQIRALLVDCGAVAFVEDLIEQLCMEALAALASAALTEPGRAALESLVDRATRRVV